MVFDVNQTEFNNDYQQQVWNYGIHMVPLTLSLRDVIIPEVREGCAQVYDCTMELLADMFHHPEEYEQTEPLDYLIWVFEWVAGVRKVPARVKKIKGLYERILAAMAKFGFAVEGGTMVNTRYPLFMKYWWMLRNKGSTLSCDFRVLAPKYRPSYSTTRDDFLRPLNDNDSKLACELYDYALSIGARRAPYNQYRPYCFVYQKKHVLVFHNADGLFAAVPYKNQYTTEDAVGELMRFTQLVQQQPDAKELIAYMQQGIMVCNNCKTTSCGKRVIDIGGVKRQIAGCRPEFGKPRKQIGYTKQDVAMLKRLMDIRMQHIDGTE